MNNHKRLNAGVLVLVLTLASTACTMNFAVPTTKITTGSTQTNEISVPMPAQPQNGAVLNLEFTAGSLTLSPGADETLVSGTSTFNVTEFTPIIETNSDSYTLQTGQQKLNGMPKFDREFVNQWDLQLADIPLTLNIQAGAYNGSFELGGLSLQKLTITEGGSDLRLAFSARNKVAMSSISLVTGGSTMVLKGLANANFAQMTLDAGAGDYTLSFDGELQRDTQVTIDSGMSTVRIIVPAQTNAKVIFEGGLSSVDTSGDWQQNDNAYTLAGKGPTLIINVKMGVGTLILSTG